MVNDFDDFRMLVLIEWLVVYLNDLDLCVLDVMWFLDFKGCDVYVEYEVVYIFGVCFFDLDVIFDKCSDLLYMVFLVELFISCMCVMGIGDGYQVVIYDNLFLYLVNWVWWIFCLMGKVNVVVLDGGFVKWCVEGCLVEDLCLIMCDCYIIVQCQVVLVCDVMQVVVVSKLGSYQIFDVCVVEWFCGDVFELCSGLWVGYIFGLLNLLWQQFFNDDGMMKFVDDLCVVFQVVGVDLVCLVIMICGLGVMVVLLMMVLVCIGYVDYLFYDGSWVEWGSFLDLKIVIGDV